MKLSLKDVFLTLRHNIWKIIAASLIGILLFGAFTYSFIEPKYTASAKMYVYNSKTDGSNISSSDLTVSKSLVDTYLIIVESDTVLSKTVEILKPKYPNITEKELSSMIYGNAINETEAFHISAAHSDRYFATDVVNTIVEIVPDEIIRIVKAGSVEMIEPAQLPDVDDYSWPLITNSFLGFLIGFFLSFGYYLITNVLDTTIYGRKEIINEFKFPILGAIPDQSDDKGSKGKNKRFKPNFEKFIIDKNTTFSVAEAYRKARTNIFYLPFEDKCRKFVVTSAISGEGKSTTAINISIMLAQSGKKVLLIDGDIRCPKVKNYLGLPNSSGLSEYLAGITNDLSIINHEKTGLDVITSGQSTSSAAELLASSRINTIMKKAEELKYDYVIIDSPPINVVTDAIVLADKVDGYLLSARAKYSDIKELKTTISALEQIDANIFGIIVNCIDMKSEQYGRYGRYGGYRKYGKYNSAYKRYEYNNYRYDTLKNSDK